MIGRREVLAGAVAFGACGAGPAWAGAKAAEDQLAALEAKSGGRLGVQILDITRGRRFGHRVDERFPMCSTFKLLATGLVLTRVDRGLEHLDRRVRYAKGDLVTYSPVTEKHVADGMTVAELCEAALTLSDNTAGNLLLDSFGGPAAIGAFARTLGDRVTRLDRMETALNEARAGDPRDTTSPAAMAGNLRRLVVGKALSPASRDRLTGWMIGARTGGERLRAGVPGTWRVADKTGSGANGTTNDIAVAWPPAHGPLIITAYLTASTGDGAARNAVLAEVGRIAAGTV